MKEFNILIKTVTGETLKITVDAKNKDVAMTELLSKNFYICSYLNMTKAYNVKHIVYAEVVEVNNENNK